MGAAKELLAQGQGAGGLSVDQAALAEGMQMVQDALRITASAEARRLKHEADLAAKGIAEVPASTEALRYSVDTHGLGDLLFDDWGELYIDRRFLTDTEMKRVKEIRGGVAANVIPDQAEAWVEAEKLSSTERVTAQREGDCWHLTAKGIGGHASAPEGTVNAIGVLVDYILEQGILSGAEEDFFYGLQRLHSDPYGVNLGLDTEDMIFTPLTIVGGVIGMEEGHVFQTVDCRYPTTSSGQDIVAQLTGNWGELAEIHVLSDDKPFYMALDNPAVQVCVDTYNAVTGEQAQPYTIGGGTYARHFPNAVSFGPEHPERPAPDFAGPIHGVDEAANIDWLMEALQIYILALIELEKLDY